MVLVAPVKQQFLLLSTFLSYGLFQEAMFDVLGMEKFLVLIVPLTITTIKTLDEVLLIVSFFMCQMYQLRRARSIF